MPRLLVHFARYGPYHHARLRSAVEALAPLGVEVMGLETAGTDATYAWDENRCPTNGPQVITAFPGRVHEEITATECKQALYALLDGLAPDAVCIAGWGSPDARACLDWCKRNGARAIVMSETRAVDGQRRWWKEWLKGRLVRRFDAALVGGKSHSDYLIKLGIPAERIRFGYNVVDNGYFASETQKHRNTETPDAPPYFLASNRFIERKNLARLIDAYASYTATLKHCSPETPPWNLCLLGDGELKPQLIAQCQKLGLNVIESPPWQFDRSTEPPKRRTTEAPKHRNTETPKHRNTVFFPGFRQIDELPRFHANAGCFVHPALEEPWGLVINEAMACGLPILSGNNVGAAEELIVEGINGWTFDSENVEEISAVMQRMATKSDGQRAALGSSSVRILQERCPTEAFGHGLAELLKTL